MKKLKNLRVILPLLAALLIGHAASAQSTQPQTSSAPSSPRLATDASKQSADKKLIAACTAAVEDLKAERQLVTALEDENAALKTRLETETRSTVLLTELNATRKSETDALRATVSAKTETITAKDAVIASQGKLIETLKKKKSSPWRRLSDVLIGAALFAILK